MEPVSDISLSRPTHIVYRWSEDKMTTIQMRIEKEVKNRVEEYRDEKFSSNASLSVAVESLLNEVDR